MYRIICFLGRCFRLEAVRFLYNFYMSTNINEQFYASNLHKKKAIRISAFGKIRLARQMIG